MNLPMQHAIHQVHALAVQTRPSIGRTCFSRLPRNAPAQCVHFAHTYRCLSVGSIYVCPSCPLVKSGCQMQLHIKWYQIRFYPVKIHQIIISFCPLPNCLLYNSHIYFCYSSEDFLSNIIIGSHLASLAIGKASL